MESGIIPELIRNSIDPGMTKNILDIINADNYRNIGPVKVKGIPSFDGKTVIDISGDICWKGNFREASERLSALTDTVRLSPGMAGPDGIISLGRKDLEEIGLHLLPFTSLGILNGGSATSYVDSIKNSSFNKKLYQYCLPFFEKFAEKYRNFPKGLAPAYINADYSEGYSFSELKMRSILLKIAQYREKIGKADFSDMLFQMTSCSNSNIIEKGFASYRNSPILEKLLDETGADLTSPMTGVQPMIPAFTHSSLGGKRGIFTDAYGEKGRILPLPGGHGQNFQVLADVYRKLYEKGKRFVYLGNVDNIGFNIDTAEVAVLALSGRQAAFDFAFKTPVDVKGGILVREESGRINCVDIGPAISAQDVDKEEKKGKPILFNCATGLFSLEFLVKNLDRIISALPLRLSDQDKDAGRYSQAEQTTWEVIGLLDDFIIFGVDKYRRFLASKLLMENLLISRPECFEQYFSSNPDDSMNKVSKNMKEGLEYLLKYEMKLTENGKKWC